MKTRRLTQTPYNAAADQTQRREPTKQIYHTPGRSLYRRLGRCGNSSAGSTSVGPRKYSARSFRRNARFHASAAATLQCLLVCVALFILLHIVGAHYTYAKMPLGLWAKTFFGFSRNHFDRVAHFGFGFFLAFPIRELLLKFSGIRRAWSFWIPVAVILAVSVFFEILESIVAEAIAPGQGVKWLGGQGDQWDAQNDMLSASLGALWMMMIVPLFKTLRPRLDPLPQGEEDAQRQVRVKSAGPHAGFIENRFLQIVLGCYVLLWIALAVHPLDRGDWFLENLLIFATAGVLIPTYWRFRFSNVSYALILIFLVFHTARITRTRKCRPVSGCRIGCI
jgi:uncharacterized membrane protein YjdF